MRILGLLCLLVPASRTRTRTKGFSVSRAATTRPAVPPPMMMKS